jgi:hypothetical protein
MTSLSARPIVALGRLPLPSTLWVAFMPSARRTGPFTTTTARCPGAGGDAVQSELRLAHGLDDRHHDRQILGQASGHDRGDDHFLGGIRRRRTGSMPTIASGAEARRLQKARHDGVGGRDDRQPVGPPLRWNSSFASKASATSYEAASQRHPSARVSSRTRAESPTAARSIIPSPTLGGRALGYDGR